MWRPRPREAAIRGEWGIVLRRLIRVVVSVATLVVMVGASPVSADSPSGCQAGVGRTPKTVVIDGRTYGPKDGLQVDTYQCGTESGSAEVGIVFSDTPQATGSITPMATWGSSYAISTEWLNQLGYDGKAKADANIFQGKRIIQVCMWYMRNNQNVSPTVCSTAASLGGSWMSGPEKRMSVEDSKGLNDPKTVFHMSTVRITP